MSETYAPYRVADAPVEALTPAEWCDIYRHNNDQIRAVLWAAYHNKHAYFIEVERSEGNYWIEPGGAFQAGGKPR